MKRTIEETTDDNTITKKVKLNEEEAIEELTILANIIRLCNIKKEEVATIFDNIMKNIFEKFACFTKFETVMARYKDKKLNELSEFDSGVAKDRLEEAANDRIIEILEVPKEQDNAKDLCCIREIFNEDRDPIWPIEADLRADYRITISDYMHLLIRFKALCGDNKQAFYTFRDVINEDLSNSYKECTFLYFKKTWEDSENEDTSELPPAGELEQVIRFFNDVEEPIAKRIRRILTTKLKENHLQLYTDEDCDYDIADQTDFEKINMTTYSFSEIWNAFLKQDSKYVRKPEQKTEEEEDSRLEEYLTDQYLEGFIHLFDPILGY